MSKRYIIWENGFIVEQYYRKDEIVDSEIRCIFDDKNKAESELKKLLVEFIKNIGFQGDDINDIDLTEEEEQNLSVFLKENFDCTLDNADELDLSTWTDEQLFQFVKVANFCPYHLEVTNEDIKYFTYWLNYPQKYFEIYEDVIHESDFEDLRNGDDLYYFLQALEKMPIHGSLEEISTDPKALSEDLELGYIEYDENEKALKITAGFYQDFQKLKRVNSLLKKPWFEVRTNYR